MVIKNVAIWARESFIDDVNLIRGMFKLLLRQYNGVNEVIYNQNPEVFYVLNVKFSLQPMIFNAKL